ncbi:MBL fold metallo-hydrolase [Agathobaculum sp. NTUH-O15-33]|nr:MBL fold metallo-hydrolase [Agathobaculum sp. NTUH-O15-33]WNX85042.1 MBL fold metallo-hydrolase [Agathobaculum sp. NTUH-O15-33]
MRLHRDFDRSGRIAPQNNDRAARGRPVARPNRGRGHHARSYRSYQGPADVPEKSQAPVYASAETALALHLKQTAPEGRLTTFEPGERFGIGEIGVTPFDTPHDAAGSVGYILSNGDTRFGFATDLGFVPGEIADQLRGCDAVVLESNHDPHMLAAGPYPYMLKQRVGGPRGHLSNPDCAVCAAELVKSGTRTLILAHLSEHNNMPALALQQTQLALKGLAPCAVYIAPRERMDAPIVLEGGVQCSLYD